MSGETETAQATSKFLDRNSRQIGTFGLETMLKLSALKVLICGASGAGLEVAKNLALAGVHTISLFDPEVASVRDLGRNFAINETNFTSGTRAQLAAALIRELNPMTRVRHVDVVDDATVISHNAVLITSGCPGLGFDLNKLAHINEVARRHSPVISFFYIFNSGTLGSIFVDHGAGFVTSDPDGRPPLQKTVVEVIDKVDKKGRSYSRIRFSTPEGMAPGSLRDKTEITFSEVSGLLLADGTSVNARATAFEGVCGLNDPANTVRVYPSFTEQGYSPYKEGGFLHEKKERTVRNFRSFRECLAEPPATILTDSMYDGSAENAVHLAMVSMLEFGRLPQLGDQDAIVQLAKGINARGKAEAERQAAAQAAAPPAPPAAPSDETELPSPLPPPPPPAPFVNDNIDEDALRLAVRLAHTELQPLSTVLGAISAQEVVKIAGKYTPIYQFLHLNMSGVLADDRKNVNNPAGTPYAAQNARYDDLVELFGADFVDKLRNLKFFMVGCGALGCEDLKNFALCGVATGPHGQLIVTDNDKIEISNLSRQFLFREDNVGQPKSAAAGLRVKGMNPSMHIDARQDFIGPSSEAKYDQRFWQNVDIVVNALDNIPARLFVDAKCVFYEKVLVEAGTMGTGGNVDIIVPHKTTSYADGGAADETGGIPMCTLRNFPYIYDHCIEWARALFADLFTAPIGQTAQLREDPAGFCAKQRAELASKATPGERSSFLSKQVKALGELERVVSQLTKEVTMQDCVMLAWQTFHGQFRDRIVSLITNFPPDATKRNGEKFWSGHKKFPQVVSTGGDRTFAKDVNINEFLISSANLYACMLGLHPDKHEPKDNNPEHRWMEQYRTRDFLVHSLGALPEPEVVVGGVEDLDEEAAGANKGSMAQPSDEELLATFEAKLQWLQANAARISSKAKGVEFEKDDDDNFHIDFVAAAANLRATNYNIPTSDRMKVKLVAGRIIPAIATTTAAVTGFALIELFKVLLGKGTSALRNGMIDVGAVNYIMFERDPPIKISTKKTSTYDPITNYTDEKTLVAWPNPHTKYDKIIVGVTRTTTVSEFADALVAPTGDLESGPYEVGSIASGTAMLWNGMPSHSNAKRPLLTVLAEAVGKGQSVEEFWAKRTLFADFSVALDTADGDEVVPATVVLRVDA